MVLARYGSRFVLTVLLLATTFLPAAVSSGQAPSPEPASDWARGNSVLLGITQPSLGFSAQWLFERSDSGDIQLQLEEERRGVRTAGTLLLVGSGALAVRDLRLERGRELDTINGPLLMLQAVLKLLERAVPGGPGAVTQDIRIGLSEPNAGIKVSALGAEGEFFAPWSVQGVIGPAGKGRVRFELEFRSSSRGRSSTPYESSIAGIWHNAAPRIALSDGMSLRGWRVHQVRQVVKPRGNFNTVGLGASPPMLFTTLGDLRKRVAEWVDEGARRARYQCN